MKVGYEDINRTKILAEIAFEELGAPPEPSYGTHFFNDLVEANIVPLAIYPDAHDSEFRENFLLQSPNVLKALAPELNEMGIAHLIHVPSCTEGRFLHVYLSGEEQGWIGYF
jgi:hypothetical protein